MHKKITQKQYAILLYEITKGLDKDKIKVKIGQFIKLLAKNNNLSLIDKIIEKFTIYEKKKRGIQEIELVSSRPINNEVRKQLNNIFKKGGEVEIKEKIDPSLLGGIVLRIGDLMIDGSIKRKLSALNSKLK